MSSFPRTHKEHTQREYPFKYASGLHLACAAQPSGVYRNGASINIGICRLVEYHASENVTVAQLPFVVHFLGPRVRLYV